MATKEIKDFGAVVTPAGADRILTQQDADDVTRKMTVSQLVAGAGGFHEANHVSGGSDPFLSTDLLEAIVKRLQESGGPTTLTIAAIADGEYLKRSGTTIVGIDPPEDTTARLLALF